MITLITDFGLKDHYVAAMKGVILGINPRASFVDVSHSISPGSILEGAFVLGQTYRYFPPDTIHLAVVDPGVGGERKALLLVTPSGYFVAPDNGLLSYVLADVTLTAIEEPPSMPEGLRLQTLPLPPGFEAISLTNPAFWRNPVSSTFHGRDIFAPVAAHLSRGVPPREFGEQVNSVLVFSPFYGKTSKNVLIGQVIHIDAFGNLVTCIKESDLPREKVKVWVRERQVSGLSPCYEKAVGLMAIAGSSGYLEVSLAGGNAAISLGAKVGDEVTVWARSQDISKSGPTLPEEGTARPRAGRDGPPE